MSLQAQHFGPERSQAVVAWPPRWYWLLVGGSASYLAWRGAGRNKTASLERFWKLAWYGNLVLGLRIS